MVRHIYVATRETTYAGRHYRPRDQWDGNVPEPPPLGDGWTLRRIEEPDGRRGSDPVAASASRGFVQWAPQPGRVQSSPLTPEEKEFLRKNPYAPLPARESTPVPSSEPETISPKEPIDPDPDNARFNEAARLRMLEIKRLAAEDDRRAAEERAKEPEEPSPPPSEEKMPEEERSSFITGSLEEEEI